TLGVGAVTVGMTATAILRMKPRATTEVKKSAIIQPAAPIKAASEPVPVAEKVVLHIETTPTGAEVRQGDRVFGLAPRDLILPRSDVAAHLVFVLAGFEDGFADVVPSRDDVVRVRLRAKRGKAARARGAVGKRPSAAAQEILPNPYH